jgi:hypothetical protein
MDKYEKVHEYKARGIKLDWCVPFKEHVKLGLIVRAPDWWKKEDSDLYSKAKWMAQIVATKRRKIFRWKQEIVEYNYAPIRYCLFCGKEL